MYCSQCGIKSLDNAKFCTECGNSLIVPESPEVPEPPEFTKLKEDAKKLADKVDDIFPSNDTDIPIKGDPYDANTYYTRGYSYYELDEYEKAVEDFSEAIEIDPYDADAYIMRGLSYHKLGENKKAVDDYTKAIHLKPDYFNAYNDRAIIYDQLGEYEKAVEDLTKAIVYHFMAHTCRIGEALGVKVKDVNIFKKTLYINHQVQSYPKHMLEGTAFLNDDNIDKNSNTVVLDELKTEESERTEKLLPVTVDPLIKLIADKDPDDLIFTTKNGTPCTPDNFRKRYWKPMLRKLGIDHKIKLTPHVMRGFVFSKGVASGQDSALLSKSLGHKNISTTLDSYFPDIEDEDRDTVNPLGHMSNIINNTATIEDTDNTKDIRSVNNSN